jgi:hypothetical protein
MDEKKPFEIECDGVTIRCETAEEVVRLLKLMKEAEIHPDSQSWKTYEFDNLLARLQDKPRRLLAFMIECGVRPIRDTELREALVLRDNKALAGVLSGISKVAQAMNIDPRRVYRFSSDYKEGKPNRSYQLTPAFHAAVKVIGWPKPEDLESSDQEP